MTNPSFKLIRRVFAYKGQFRWIVTDKTAAYGTIMAHGVSGSTRKARAEAGQALEKIRTTK